MSAAPNPQHQASTQPNYTSPTKPSKEQRRSLRRELKDNRHEMRRDMKAQRKEIRREGKERRQEVKVEYRRGGAVDGAQFSTGHPTGEDAREVEVTEQDYGVQMGDEHGVGSSGPPPGYEQATMGSCGAEGGSAAAAEENEKTSH